MHNNPQDCCEWCQGELDASGPIVHFAEKPFHPWCREQFVDEMYGNEPDEVLIEEYNAPIAHEDFVSLEELTNFQF